MPVKVNQPEEKRTKAVRKPDPRYELVRAEFSIPERLQQKVRAYLELGNRPANYKEPAEDYEARLACLDAIHESFFAEVANSVGLVPGLHPCMRLTDDGKKLITFRFIFKEG
jgi:hypothetical protein